jgi:5'-nucleotidase
MNTRSRLSTLVLAALAALPAAFAQYSVTVLHNNDGESALIQYSDAQAQYGGVARFATLLDNTRDFYTAQGHGVVSIYAGDTFLAGARFQASLDSGAPGSRTFYDALAISHIGYDASIIGNHEFDFGPSVLAEFIGDAQTTNATTYLSSNLNFASTPSLQSLVTAGTIAPSKIVNVNTSAGVKKVGIIGATTTDLPFVSSPETVTVGAVAAAVNTQISLLQDAGADVIILGSHLQGIRTENTLVSSLNPGIDLIIAGGGSELLRTESAAAVLSGAPATVATTGFIPGDSEPDITPLASNYPTVSTFTDLGGNAIPIVTTDGNYGYLGRVTLNVDALGAVSVDTSSNPQRVASTTADAANGVAPDAAIVTDAVTPVSSFVSGLAATDLANTSVQLFHGGSSTIRSRQTNLGNFVADAFLDKATDLAPGFSTDQPDFALVNAGGIRANIAAGDVSRLNTFNVSPFGNFLAVVPDVKAADLKLLLENAFSRTTDSDAGPGITVAGSDGRFAQLSEGISVAYNPNASGLRFDANGVITTVGNRILVITVDGVTIYENGVWNVDAETTTFDIATTAFSANGGDQYFRTASGGTATYLSKLYGFDIFTGTTDQQALQDYIAQLTGGNTAFDLTGSGANPDYLVQTTFQGSRISAIPEPSAFAALAGLAGLALAASRRRRA